MRKLRISTVGVTRYSRHTESIGRSASVSGFGGAFAARVAAASPVVDFEIVRGGGSVLVFPPNFALIGAAALIANATAISTAASAAIGDAALDAAGFRAGAFEALAGSAALVRARLVTLLSLAFVAADVELDFETVEDVLTVVADFNVEDDVEDDAEDDVDVFGIRSAP